MEEAEVVVGSYESLIQGFSINTLEPEKKGLCSRYHESDHTGSVRALACNGHYLTSGGVDESIKLYDIRKHREVGTLHQHGGSITCLAFHGSHLFSASEDRTICMWKCGTWECVHILQGHRGPVTCVSVHPSGKLLLSVGKDRTLRTWNLLTGCPAYTQKLKEGAAELVLWNRAGDQYSLSFRNRVSVYALDSGALVCSVEVEKQITSILYVKEQLMAVASELHSIGLHSTVDGKCLARLEGHQSRVKALGLIETEVGNTILVSVSSDGVVKAWRAAAVDNVSEYQCVSSVTTQLRPTCLTVVTTTTKHHQKDTKSSPQPEEQKEGQEEEEDEGNSSSEDDEKDTQDDEKEIEDGRTHKLDSFKTRKRRHTVKHKSKVKRICV